MKVIWGAVQAAVFSLATLTGAHGQTVTLEGTPDGVEAHYDLHTLPLLFANPDVDRSDWDLTGAPHREQATQDPAAFTLALRPDRTEDGRGYIALLRAGDGYVVYGPALAVSGATLSLATMAPQSWRLWPAKDSDGYVYFGPPEYIQLRPGHAEIAAPTVSSEITHTVFSAFTDALSFYQENFGPLIEQPTLVVSTQGAGPSDIRADVTDTGVISVRFNGDGWLSPSHAALADADTLTFHETAHLWNSHFARPADGSPWLHEGGAQYLALIAAVSTGHMTEEAARLTLGSNLTACRRRLAARADIASRMNSGSAVYDCGVLVQWVADMEIRRSSHGSQSVVDRWKALVAAARESRGVYDPQTFRAGLSVDSAVTSLLDGPAETRWSAIEARLSELGVTWANRPSEEDYLVATLSHLNRENCQQGSSTGFYIREGFIQMGNAQTCGVLSGDVEIDTVEGFDPLTASRGMFDAVRIRCADQAPIRIVRRDTSQGLSANCSTALAMPVSYALETAPGIGIKAASDL